MLFRFSDIGSKNQELSGSLDLESVRERLNSDSFIFNEPPTTTLQLSRNIEGIEVRGTLLARFYQNCGRCLEDKERTEKIPIFFLIRKKPKPQHQDHNDDRYEDDVGIYHVDEENIDLSPFLEEHLVLGLSLYWSPELTQSGKCKLCGKGTPKLEEPKDSGKQTLKELLEKAAKERN